MLVPDNNQGQNDGKGIGQMVLFSVGETENAQTKATTYYMPNAYRFICRMYYKAQTGSDDFDVEGGTDQTVWMKVSGNVGNSLYWNKEYNTPSRYDGYGNDYNANALYWQNRKEHAFLAWTDLNNARNIVGGSDKGTLKFGKDIDYKVYTGNKVDMWVVSGYKLYGSDQLFTSTSAIREYVEKTYDTPEKIAQFNAAQKVLGDQYSVWDEKPYQYMFGWSCKYTTSSTDGVRLIDATHRDYKWYRYLMFFQKYEYVLEGDLTDYIWVIHEDKDGNEFIKYLRKDDIYVAEAEVLNEKNSDGKYIDGEGHVIDNPSQLTYRFYQTDEYGNALYNEENPLFTFYYQRLEENKKIDEYNEFPALAFDLKRGTKNNMTEQPDIAQAREIQAPVGATQESNRVNLYFKHKFSQVYVNVRESADNSAKLDRNQITKVELLGVSEEGYIFTELDKDGNVMDAAYKEINFSDYTEEQLRNNPYGTSFRMFELPEAETELGYLKSFNAITFGQLQAIRITWQETEGTGAYEHAATFRIPDTDLVNLKSGTRYIWNIEIRRGTLAIIRTEIIDWELPTDEEHNGSVDGTISD